MGIAVVAALAAGALFAGGAVLQQRVAATRPESESLSPRLLLHLFANRTWLAGVGVGVLSYVFQAVALSMAPLSVVQPLIVTELLFAVPLAARLRHGRLGRREWGGIVAVAGGLAAAIVSADPTSGNPLASFGSWLPWLVGAVIVAGGAIAAGRSLAGPVRASLYALAAAIAMGMEAGLMSATTQRFSDGVVTGFTSWQPYAMAAASIIGLLLIQSAFQAGPLAASMPVSDGVEPLVAIGLGLALFGEHLTTAPWRLGIAAAGLAALMAGIVLLDTSPVVQRLYERQSDAESTAALEPAA